MSTEIPNGNEDHEHDGQPGHPAWFSVCDLAGRNQKPLIRCNCGKLTGIGLHHVHADGSVSASFYHKKGDVYPEDPEGCEWHVHLKLLDYNEGDFPAEK